jgi:hypothetical protein
MMPDLLLIAGGIVAARSVVKTVIWFMMRGDPSRGPGVLDLADPDSPLFDDKDPSLPAAPVYHTKSSSSERDWPERISVEVVTEAGATARVEFRTLAQWVEVWHRERRVAVLDRGHLSSWLTATGPPLRAGSMELAVDGTADNWCRVAISLPDVDAGAFSPDGLDRLRTAVRV